MKKLILQLLIFTTILTAQTTTKIYVVKNSAKFLPSELISKQVRDVNGDVCAGLIILSDLTGLSYDSYNGITKKNSEPGKDFLFLQPSERVVEIYKSGYEPLKIILNEYGIHLKSGTTWQIKVTGDKKLDLIPITIMKNQADAKIYIDGKLKGTENAQQVSAGKHVIRIEKTGYNQIIDTVNVTTSNIYFDYKLKTVQLVAVIFNSKPTNAQVIINNNLKGTTKFGDYFYPDKYKIRVVKSGYLDYEKEIDISAIQKDFTFNLTKNSSLLKLTLYPKDAEVKLNNQIYKKSELELQPGTYNLEVLKSGYLPVTDVVTLALGDTLAKSYTLTKNVAYLKLNITPNDAKIELNKKIYQIADSLTLAPGTYQIDISKDGYHPITESVNLALGKCISKKYVLKQKLGGIRFTIKPLSANVTLQKYGNIVKKWQGMNEITDLPIGKYQLICNAKGYKTKTIDISITENNTTIKSVTLDVGNDFVDVAFNLDADASYELFVDGESKGTVFGNEKIETGKHTIELKKDGKSVKSVVFIGDKTSNEISIESEPKTGIILLSALLPGLGQITHGRTAMGAIYMGAFAGAAAYHYMNYKSYNDLKGDLKVLTNRYNNTTNPTDKYNLAKKINNKQSETDRAYNKAKTSIWFPIGAYAISLFDALVYPTAKIIKIADNRTLQIIPNLALTPNGTINVEIYVKF